MKSERTVFLMSIVLKNKMAHLLDNLNMAMSLGMIYLSTIEKTNM